MADEYDVIYLPPYYPPAKPKYKEPCNGCGFCCHEEVCLIGQAFYETTTAPCPGITYIEGKVRCGVILIEDEIIGKGKVLPGNKTAREMLGINTYCDAQMHEEISQQSE